MQYILYQNEFNGGMNYSKPVTTIPNKPFEEYGYAMHIDTKVFCEYIVERLKKVLSL